MEPEKKETNERDLAPQMRVGIPILGIDYKTTDLRGSVRVVLELKRPVDEAGIDRFREFLLAPHFKIKMRRIRGPVLSRDHRGSHHPMRFEILRHEEVLRIELIGKRVAKRGDRALDFFSQQLFVVRKIDKARNLRESLKRHEVVFLDLAKKNHRHVLSISFS